MSKITVYNLIFLLMLMLIFIGNHIYLSGYAAGAKDMVIKINHVNEVYTDA